jgi:hypothetical protein
LYKEDLIEWLQIDVESFAFSTELGIICPFFCFCFYFLHVIVDIESIIKEYKEGRLTDYSKDSDKIASEETTQKKDDDKH